MNCNGETPSTNNNRGVGGWVLLVDVGARQGAVPLGAELGLPADHQGLLRATNRLSIFIMFLSTAKQHFIGAVTSTGGMLPPLFAEPGGFVQPMPLLLHPSVLVFGPPYEIDS